MLVRVRKKWKHFIDIGIGVLVKLINKPLTHNCIRRQNQKLVLIMRNNEVRNHRADNRGLAPTGNDVREQILLAQNFKGIHASLYRLQLDFLPLLLIPKRELRLEMA